MSLSAATPVASREPSAPDAAALVADFVKEGRSERAFERLVEGLGGLVYASAKRRTNDPQLAEEVSQNVFAILARKAAAVSNHPAPLAWIFQTTKHEASKAMRAVRRRQRKHDALAQYQLAQDGAHPKDEQSWREALAHLDASLDQLHVREREVVLQRFFQDRKFKDIAAATGQSEAACKMRLRRTLDKLARLLAARGVALSSTALASLLTAEMSKAAPIALVSSSAQVLGQGHGLGFATILSNSIHTMSTAKSATLTAVAVFILAAGPVIWQHSEAREKRERINELLVERDQLANDESKAASRAGRRGGNARPRTVREVMAAVRASSRPEDMAQQLMEAFGSQDIMGMLRVFMTLVHLNNEEIGAVISAINDHPAPTQVKGTVLQVLAEFAPQHDARQGLEQALKMGVEPYRIGYTLKKWAQHRPEEALAWYQKLKENGSFVGTGLSDDPSDLLYGFLLGGLSKQSPEKAVALFEDASIDAQYQAIHSILEELASDGVGESFRTQAKAMMKAASDPVVEANVLNGALREVQSQEGASSAVNFLKEFEIDSTIHGQCLSTIAIQLKDGTNEVPEVAERGQWLLAQAQGESRQPALKGFVEGLIHTEAVGVPEWIENAVPSDLQDTAWLASARVFAERARHQESLQASLQLAEGAKRDNALRTLGQHWAQRNREEGRTAFEHAGLVPDDYGLEEAGKVAPNRPDVP